MLQARYLIIMKCYICKTHLFINSQESNIKCKCETEPSFSKLIDMMPKYIFNDKGKFPSAYIYNSLCSAADKMFSKQIIKSVNSETLFTPQYLKKLSERRHVYNITDLIKFLTLEDYSNIEALNFYDIEIIKPPGTIINYIDIQTQSHGSILIFESIAALVGDACTIYIEYKVTDHISSIEISNNVTALIILYKKIIRETRKFNTISETLKIINCLKPLVYIERLKYIRREIYSLLIDHDELLSNLICIIADFSSTIHGGYSQKFNLQMRRYDIITNKMLQHIVKRANKIIRWNNPKFEVTDSSSITNLGKSIKVIGRYDIINSNNLFEIKFKHKITKEDIYQILLYTFISENKFDSYKIVNLKTGEIIKVILTSSNKLDDFVRYLIRKKL